MSAPWLYLAKSFTAGSGPPDTAWYAFESVVLLAFGAAVIEDLSVLFNVHLPGSRFQRQAAE